MAEKETKNTPKDLVEATPEDLRSPQRGTAQRSEQVHSKSESEREEGL